jgi:hypothetical protein
VPEGTVTDEIQEDLLKLGWIPREWDDDNVWTKSQTGVLHCWHRKVF